MDNSTLPTDVFETYTCNGTGSSIVYMFRRNTRTMESYLVWISNSNPCLDESIKRLVKSQGVR